MRILALFFVLSQTSRLIQLTRFVLSTVCFYGDIQFSTII